MNDYLYLKLGANVCNHVLSLIRLTKQINLLLSIRVEHAVTQDLTQCMLPVADIFDLNHMRLSENINASNWSLDLSFATQRLHQGVLTMSITGQALQKLESRAFTAGLSE